MHLITIVITNIRSLRIYSNIRLTFEYTKYSNIRPPPNVDYRTHKTTISILTSVTCM